MYSFEIWDFFVCFSRPTSPPLSFIGLVQGVSSYTLSSPTFKGVSRRMNYHNAFILFLKP